MLPPHPVSDSGAGGRGLPPGCPCPASSASSRLPGLLAGDAAWGQKTPSEWKRFVGVDSAPAEAAWVMAWDEFSSCKWEQLVCTVGCAHCPGAVEGARDVSVLLA